MKKIKRLLALCLCGAAVLACVPTVSSSAESTPHYGENIMFGDANHDGNINLSDVTLIMQYAAKWDVEICTGCADIYKNGFININDVTYTLKCIAMWEKPSSVPDIGVPETYLYGDVTGDGVINLSDVTVTLKSIAGWWNIGINKKRADLSGDGKLTVADVTLMLQIIAGWEYA